MVPPAHGWAIAEAIPGARLVLLPGSDHIFLHNEGRPVVDEVETFVTGTLTSFADLMHAAMLFTDIVDSTVLAVTLGDERWQRAHRPASARVLRQIERTGAECSSSTRVTVSW